VDISTVAFDKKQLAMNVDSIVTDSVERMLQLFADEPTKETIDPFKASDANVRNTKAQYTAYIPYEVMDILLGEYVTAHQSYALIVPFMVDSGFAEICDPLVKLLTMALIKPSATRATHSKPRQG
jgi:hypothetical protein